MIPSRIRLLPLLAISGALAASTGSTRAQVPDVPPPEATAIPLGWARFWPLLETGIERSSNLFQVAGVEGIDKRAATISTVSPGAILELPFSHSWARLGYVASYRDYGVADVDSKWSTFLNAATRLRFASGLVVEGADELQRGVLDARTIDPGGDVTFRGQTLRQNRLRIGIGQERDDRVLFLRGQRSRQRTIGENPADLFDVDEDRLELTGDHRTSSRTSLGWQVVSRHADLSRDVPLGAETKTVRGRIVRIGGTGPLGATGDWTVMSGWAEFTFHGIESSRYRGMALEGELRRHVSGRPSITARLQREPYPILGGAGNYYLSHQLAVEVESPAESRLVLGGSLTYYANVFPGAGRRDDLLEFEGWTGYRFGRGVEWRVFARGVRRDSNEPLARYADARLGTSFRVGMP